MNAGDVLSSKLANRRSKLTAGLVIQRQVGIRQKEIAQMEMEASSRRLENTELSPFANDEPTTLLLKKSCLLRPATKEDMKGALEVYNQEISQGNQANDTRLLILQDFEKIFHETQGGHLPFIVAVAIQEIILHPKSRLPKNLQSETSSNQVEITSPTAKSRLEVLGFCFISEYERGLTGGSMGTSRYSGKLNIFVHPLLRQKGIGQALLDKTLELTCWRHLPFGGYAWQNDDSGEQTIYQVPPIRNKRHLHRLYIDGHYDGQNDVDLKWQCKLLDKFAFVQVGVFKRSHRTLRGNESKWLDKIVWEHICNDANDVGVEIEWGVRPTHMT